MSRRVGVAWRRKGLSNKSRCKICDNGDDTTRKRKIYAKPTDDSWTQRDEIIVVDSWCDGCTRVCSATVNWSRDANVDWFARTTTKNLRLGTRTRSIYESERARHLLYLRPSIRACFPVIVSYFFFSRLFASDPSAGRPPPLIRVYRGAL